MFPTGKTSVAGRHSGRSSAAGKAGGNQASAGKWLGFLDLTESRLSEHGDHRVMRGGDRKRRKFDLTKSANMQRMTIRGSKGEPVKLEGLKAQFNGKMYILYISLNGKKISVSERRSLAK